ncbi:MAG: GGDEF domain-containing protein [Luteibacter sp.]
MSGSLLCRWLAAAGLAICMVSAPVVATPAPPPADDTTALFARAEAIRLRDHAHFLEVLARLRAGKSGMDARQAWHLRYLDAWEIMFEGRYKASEAIFRDVIAHSADEALIARSTALLMSNLMLQARYVDAYVEASDATDMLPRVTDPFGRFALLANLSQTLNFAGQMDLALKYADMMTAATPPGESPCQAYAMKVAALEGGKLLTSRSPELAKAIADCKADGQPVYANSMSLILGDRYLAEQRPRETLALLDRIGPGIDATGYFPHRLAMTQQRASAWVQLHDTAQARKAGLEALAMSHPGDANIWLRDAYKALYEAEKMDGNAAAALAYHEQYVKQEQGRLQDDNARALAYQAARQRVNAQKLETTRLSEENEVMRLQSVLDGKTVESGRLYIGLLAVVVLAIAFWLVRLRRSQLRFKRLSTSDGLTGIFVQRHFVDEAEACLGMLRDRAAPACMLSLDLDHFKAINDTHGHAVGDAALKHVVDVCRNQLRKADLFGRLGGEEFGILLPDTSHDEGLVIAERLRQAIVSSPLVVRHAVVQSSASIGLACTEADGYELAYLCRASDTALYRAKRGGRNRVADASATDGAERRTATR